MTKLGKETEMDLEKAFVKLQDVVNTMDDGWEALTRIRARLEGALEEQREKDARIVHNLQQLYKNDPKGWCSSDHPCKHSQQVDCVLAAIRRGDADDR